MRAQAAIRRVPRELFIPDTIWVTRDDGWNVPLRRQDDPRRWREACHADAAVVTQVDDGAVDIGVEATSSSSAAFAMEAMIEALDLHEGMTVLEIGTGTGYNAAVLAEMVGVENVTTIEIDPVIAAQANRALHNADFPVHVVTGDGVMGYPRKAPYDRIIVTAAAYRIPQAWVKQTRTGGLIVVPWAPTFHTGYPLATLTVRGDGTAEGRFTDCQAAFMALRSQRWPQRLVHATRTRWVAAGEPAERRFGITVTPDQQSIWLDRPEQPVTWENTPRPPCPACGGIGLQRSRGRDADNRLCSACGGTGESNSSASDS